MIFKTWLGRAARVLDSVLMPVRNRKIVFIGSPPIATPSGDSPGLSPRSYFRYAPCAAAGFASYKAGCRCWWSLMWTIVVLLNEVPYGSPSFFIFKKNTPTIDRTSMKHVDCVWVRGTIDALWPGCRPFHSLVESSDFS